MGPENNQDQDSRTRSLLWMAGAIGAAAGIASLVYKSRSRSRWDIAKERASQVADAARAEVKPWMGAAAGAAVGLSTWAYKRSRQQSDWDRAGKRARQIAVRTQKQVQPWLGIAASAAISLASAAYDRKQRKQVKDATVKGGAIAGARLADAGLRIFRRVQRISGEAEKIYPRVKRLIA